MKMNKQILEEAINEALDWSDIYTEDYIGCGDYERTYIDISDLTDEIIEKYQVKLRDKNITEITK